MGGGEKTKEAEGAAGGWKEASGCAKEGCRSDSAHYEGENERCHGRWLGQSRGKVQHTLRWHDGLNPAAEG